ncbi:MAG TPA: sugar phosphate isomerase/epimerase family protein [Pilimelia sp.]|nr:sugar phosphate isomerase/epimerase family protein [Pilimelia sp.]
MTALVCGIGDEAAPHLPDQLRIHTELGFAGIELRTVSGRGLHELSDSDADAVAEAVAATGMRVPVVDTPIGGWSGTVADDLDRDVEILRCSAARAASLGCRRLRVMSYPNDGRPPAAWRSEAIRRMRVLAGVAADLDVVLLHENCHGWGSQSAATTIELIETVGSGHLRLLFDVGNGLAYGYDAVPFLRSILPWVDHVHVKDGVRGPDGAVFGLPGDGDADVAGCLRLLGDAGYAGWYSLEPHVTHIPHLRVSADPARLEAGYRACADRFLAVLGAVHA